MTVYTVCFTLSFRATPPASPPPRLLPQRQIGQHQRRHGLDDGHGPRHHAGIVAAPSRPARRPSPRSPPSLRPADGGRRLEGHPEDDRLAVGDPALHPAAAVGRGAQRPSPRATKASLCSEPRSRVPAKPEPISKPLVAGSESMAPASKASVLLEHRLAPAGGAAAAHAGDDAAHRVAVVAGGGDGGGDAAGRGRIGAAHRVGVDRRRVHRRRIHRPPRRAPTASTQATISTPKRTRSSCSATAPAATRADGLAGAGPAAAAAARMPYFCW